MGVGADDYIDRMLVQKYQEEKVDNHDNMESMVDPEKMMGAMNDYAATLRNMMEPTRQENKTIYLVVDDEKVERVYELADEAVGGFDNPNTGIFVSLPVDFVRGVHKK